MPVGTVNNCNQSQFGCPSVVMVKTASGPQRSVYNPQTQSYVLDLKSQKSAEQPWNWGQILGNTLKWTLGIGVAVIGTMAIASNLYARNRLNALHELSFSAKKGSSFEHGKQMAEKAKEQDMIDSDGHFYAQSSYWFGENDNFKLLRKENISNAMSDEKEGGAGKFGSIVYKFKVGEKGEALYKGVHRSEFGTFFELASIFSELQKKRS